SSVIKPSLPPKRGFYQRFDEVVKSLNDFGITLPNIMIELKLITECFQVRHIATHNMGYVDKEFKKKTGTKIAIGKRFLIEQPEYHKYYHAYMALLRGI